MSEAISAHKKMAMGMTEGNVMKKGGKVAKYARGGSVKKPADVMYNEPKGAERNRIGAVPESKAQTLINNSSQKLPFVKPTGKIATLKKGGMAAKKPGLMIVVSMGKKPAARGR